MAMLICLHLIYSCFHATKVEFSGGNDNPVVFKSSNVYHLALNITVCQVLAYVH